MINNYHRCGVHPHLIIKGLGLFITSNDYWCCLYFEVFHYSQQSLKEPGYFLLHKTQCPQIYFKLKQFEGDCRKLPLKFYLLRCCSFLEIQVTKGDGNYFCIYVKRIFITLFTNFSKTAAPQQLIFKGKPSIHYLQTV